MVDSKSDEGEYYEEDDDNYCYHIVLLHTCGLCVVVGCGFVKGCSVDRWIVLVVGLLEFNADLDLYKNA